MSKEITIKKEIDPIVTKATDLIITDKTMPEAVTILSETNKLLTKITKEKETITKPLNEALKVERARWKPLEDNLNLIISTIRKKMSDYQTAMIKKQKEDEAKIANRVGEGRGKLKIETAINKIENLDKPEVLVSTEAGSVKFRTTYQLEITDESLIPRQYLTINERLLTNDLKNGHTIPGASLRERQVPINYRT